MTNQKFEEGEENVFKNVSKTGICGLGGSK
jgi:hypothetical protein